MIDPSDAIMLLIDHQSGLFQNWLIVGVDFLKKQKNRGASFENFNVQTTILWHFLRD